MTGADTAVVVIGAGPTGVTAASLLAAYGVDCLVLDRWADVYPQPRAVHLDDEVYRVLGRLGLAGEFAAISRPATGLRLLDHEHRVLAEFRRDQLVGVHGYPQANMFEQPELESLLRRQMATLPTVAFRGGVEVTAVDHVTDDRVRVVYNDRDSGAEEIVTAKFVLGCDGANSLVRSRNRRHHGAARVRAAVAGHRRADRLQPRRLGRRSSGLRHRTRCDVHAHRASPIPVGVDRGVRSRQQVEVPVGPGSEAWVT